MKFINIFNVIDIALVIVLMRIVYISLRQGAVVESLKLLGTIVSIFVILHFYLNVTDSLSNFIRFPKRWLELSAFLLLWLLMTLIFRIIRDGILLLVRKQEQKKPEFIWLAAGMGCVRGIIVCGLVFLALLLIPNKDVATMAHQAKSAPFFRQVPLKVYGAFFQTAVGKFFPAEEYRNPGFYL